MQRLKKGVVKMNKKGGKDWKRGQAKMNKKRRQRSDERAGKDG